MDKKKNRINRYALFLYVMFNVKTFENRLFVVNTRKNLCKRFSIIRQVVADFIDLSTGFQKTVFGDKIQAPYFFFLFPAAEHFHPAPSHFIPAYPTSHR
jgi:hypothetical protein